ESRNACRTGAVVRRCCSAPTPGWRVALPTRSRGCGPRRCGRWARRRGRWSDWGPTCSSWRWRTAPTSSVARCCGYVSRGRPAPRAWRACCGSWTVMRIGEVIGTVTLSRVHASLVGARWIIGVPCSLKALAQDGPGDGEDVVIYDNLGAGAGSRVGFSEGVEAAAPFHPKKTPVDAYCGCILDKVIVSQEG